MYSRVIEAEYPLSFREKDSVVLGRHLRHRHSVTMIGMKRVGISNFLRFFFSHADAQEAYVLGEEKHIFIVVDLNDLIEREIFPFWTLVLKRIADTVERIEISPDQKKEIDSLFLKSIQIQDHFMTMDSVRQAIEHLIEKSFVPTLFFVHFDRIKEKVTPAFFDNLEGLLNSSGNKLSYVFTSFRQLTELSPEVFVGNPLPFYCENMFVPLASKGDMETIFTAYNSRYQLSLSSGIKAELFNLVSGHIQYLQLSLLALREYARLEKLSSEGLLDVLNSDERIVLQSEELWESLIDTEKDVLIKVVRKESLTEKERKLASYLWDTQLLIEKKGESHVFSLLFVTYIQQLMGKKEEALGLSHFTKKENALFNLLKDNKEEICERDTIISMVWSEYVEAGISDWAIDRLVARVRAKLRKQKSKYEIKTIRTRGYQLVEK